MTDCQFCINNFHKKVDQFKDLPRPAEVMIQPPRHLFDLWEEARLYRERYSAALADAILVHDSKGTDSRAPRVE